jgi:hypothetical protein
MQKPPRGAFACLAEAVGGRTHRVRHIGSAIGSFGFGFDKGSRRLDRLSGEDVSEQRQHAGGVLLKRSDTRRIQSKSFGCSRGGRMASARRGRVDDNGLRCDLDRDGTSTSRFRRTRQSSGVRHWPLVRAASALKNSESSDSRCWRIRAGHQSGLEALPECDTHVNEFCQVPIPVQERVARLHFGACDR